MVRALVSTLLMLLLASHAYALEVNLGVTDHSGAADSVNYHADVSVSNKEAYASAEWNYGMVEDIKTSDNGHMKIGYDPRINMRWSLWFFNRTGYNDVRGIQIETFLGFGPKYTFIRNAYEKVSLSAGYLYHYEDHRTASKRTKRLSIRPKASYKGNDMAISFVAFYQPDIEDFDDYILMGRFKVDYKIKGGYTIGVLLDDEYRSVTEGEKNELTKMLVLGIKI